MGRDEAVGAVAAGDGCEASGGVVVAFVVADADGGDCCCCCCCEEQGEEGELHFWWLGLDGLLFVDVDVCSGMIATLDTSWYIYFFSSCSAAALGLSRIIYLTLPYRTSLSNLAQPSPL